MPTELTFVRFGSKEPHGAAQWARTVEEKAKARLREQIFAAYPDADTTGCIVKCAAGEYRFGVDLAVQAIQRGGQLLIPNLVKVVEESKQRRRK